MKFTKETPFIFFRAGVCIILLVHGVDKLISWDTSIPGLGAFLNSKGLVFGNLFAVLITLLETAGALMVAAGKYVRWVALIFVVYLIMGILMVHMHNGWFVVGPSQDGMEYNVLLVICMLYIWMHPSAAKPVKEQKSAGSGSTAY